MASTIQQIRQEILNNPKLKNEARKLAEKILTESKKELIDEFNNHPVTNEIESGASAPNRSRTLGGKGNLFSFIGFSSGDNPVAPVRSLLQKIQLSSSSGRVSGNNIEFKVVIPSSSEFESVTKMPWESGRSWLYDIEKTISGLGSYIYGKFNNSRSGTGAQSQRPLSGAVFTPVKYFSAMLEKFKQKLK